jgi:S1-C subfamily serine protease
MVRAVVESAKSGNDFFERPFLGASFEPVTPQIADALGMSRPHGALVSSVVANAPAGQAGLKAGDVILSMNGAPIEHVDALGYRLATQPIGMPAAFTVLSGGAEKALEITLVRAPEGATAVAVSIRGRSPFAGTKVQELSPRLAQRLGLRQEATGVAVVDIAPNSPAAGFGLQPRDIVREVNGEEIDSAEKLKQIASTNSRWWRFTVERDGELLRQTLRY